MTGREQRPPAVTGPDKPMWSLVFIRTQIVGFQFEFVKLSHQPRLCLLDPMAEAWEHLSSPLGRPCLQKTGELMAAGSVCKHGGNNDYCYC